MTVAVVVLAALLASAAVVIGTLLWLGLVEWYVCSSTMSHTFLGPEQGGPRIDVEEIPCRRVEVVFGRICVEFSAAALAAHADPGRIQLYYSELQAAKTPASLAAAIAFRLDPLLEEARDDVDTLRRLLDEAIDRVVKLEELAAGAQAIALGAPPDETTLLRGRSIADQAIQVALAHGRRELHYSEWYELIRQDGYVIVGKDPAASLLVALSRHPRVESAGARTGVYRIADIPDPEPEGAPA